MNKKTRVSTRLRGTEELLYPRAAWKAPSTESTPERSTEYSPPPHLFGGYLQVEPASGQLFVSSSSAGLDPRHRDGKLLRAELGGVLHHYHVEPASRRVGEVHVPRSVLRVRPKHGNGDATSFWKEQFKPLVSGGVAGCLFVFA